MRDLLFLAHRIPYPPDKGDKIRSFHILKHLSKHFRVHLGCFMEDASDARYVRALRDICADVFCLPLTTSTKIVRSARAIVHGEALSAGIYSDARMVEWVERKIWKDGIRHIFVFCSAVSPYVLAVAGKASLVIDMVDIDSEKWSAYARQASWPTRLIYRREQRRLFALERRAAMASEICIFVSEAEARYFTSLAPETTDRVRHLDNGVDIDYFNPSLVFPTPFARRSIPIVFTGMMDYRPNVDAVVWFLQQAMPKIISFHPNAEFWIVGRNPVSDVKRLSAVSAVRVTGGVPDVRPYVANAACVVAPLRIARGVQNKVLEAMAMAKPVVLTPAALEGIDAVAGSEILVANTANDFARLVSEVIMGKHPGLGAAARSRAERSYSWHHNLKALDEIFPVNLADEAVTECQKLYECQIE